MKALTQICIAFVFGMCVILLTLTIRGLPGNPSSAELLDKSWNLEGPFELSPEKGRFALTYSIAEDNSVYFSEAIAKFVSPDVAVNGDKFVSLFAPGLSYLVLPGYLIGKMVNHAQIGSFAVISLFALCNLFLLYRLAKLFGANDYISLLSGLLFVFATPAFSYAVTLYQHHVSTFLMLMSIYSLLSFKKYFAYVIVFFCVACSIPLDYPNLFFLAPIVIYTAFRIVKLEKIRHIYSITIEHFGLLTPIITIIPISLFLIFNTQSYGDPFRISGTFPTTKHVSNLDSLSADEIVAEVARQQNEAKSAGKEWTITGNFFQTRLLLNGFYIHFFSPDRGMVYFTPILFLGFIGFIIGYRKNIPMISVFLGIVLMNILLYSLWIDPWGGWAFGSRYLIPTYAILSLLISVVLTHYGKNVILLTFTIVLILYSVSVNSLGALTTNLMPPKVEVLELEALTGIEQKYTYERSFDLIQSGNSKSYLFKTYFQRFMSAFEYYLMITSMIVFMFLALITFHIIYVAKGEKND